MKKTISKPSKATRLLLLTCTTLATCLFSFGNAAAQDCSGATFSLTANPPSLQVNTLTLNSTSNSFQTGTLDNLEHTVIEYTNAPTFDLSDCYINGNNGDFFLAGTTNVDGTDTTTLSYQIPTNANIVIVGQPNTITNSFTIGNLSISTNCTLFVDGTLTVKSISCDSPDATIVVTPHGVIDLGGSTLTVSSLTFEDGSQVINGTFSIDNMGEGLPNANSNIEDILNSYTVFNHDGNFDLGNQTYNIPSFNFANGGTIINGTVIIDSSNTNAIHLMEGNVPALDNQNDNGGTLTLPSIPYSGGVTGVTMTNGTIDSSRLNRQ